MSKREGQIIKVARDRACMTQTDLALLANSSTTAISELETGKRKAPVHPEEMVLFSDCLGDRIMLAEYCNGCPVRARIIPRKFSPLNAVKGGALGANYKLSEKLNELAEKVPGMMAGILNPKFQEDPEAEKFVDRFMLTLMDIKRVAETVAEKMVAEGYLSEERVHMLTGIHQVMCEEKGYHIQD